MRSACRPEATTRTRRPVGGEARDGEGDTGEAGEGDGEAGEAGEGDGEDLGESDGRRGEETVAGRS